jgi:siroheme synthase
VISGTVATLPRLAEAANIDTPALIIVGHVVTLRKQLNWLEKDSPQRHEGHRED